MAQGFNLNLLILELSLNYQVKKKMAKIAIFYPPLIPPLGGMDPAKNCNKLQFPDGSQSPIFDTLSQKPTLFFFFQFPKNKVTNFYKVHLLHLAPKVGKVR